MSRKQRPLKLALDLGGSYTGLAALYRCREQADGRTLEVTAWAEATGDVAQQVRKLRPRVIIAEEAGRDADDPVVKDVVEAAKKVSKVFVKANVSTWKKAVFGTPRVCRQEVDKKAMAELDSLYREFGLGAKVRREYDRDAWSAIVLLMCWNPPDCLLAHGRSKVKLTARHEGPSRFDGYSTVCKGAKRLYSTLHRAARLRSRAGVRLLCKHAGVSPNNYQRYISELEREGCIRVRRGPKDSVEAVEVY